MQYLWIQSKIKDGDLKLQKVFEKNNVADAMTKAVDRWAFGQVHGIDDLHIHARSRGQHLALSSLGGSS